MANFPRYEPMEVFKEIGHDSYTVYLSGELDASNSLVVDDALQKALTSRKGNVWIDFENLHYISSTGLGVFLSYYHTFKAKDIRMVLYNMSPKIRDVFRLLGLEGVVTIVNTLEEARALNAEEADEPRQRQA